MRRPPPGCTGPTSSPRRSAGCSTTTGPARVLEALRRTEREPFLLGASAPLLVAGYRA
ncbi:hypothetical protein [Geodermatophilus sp. SYSU D00710]